MPYANQPPPETNVSGLRAHWRNDLIAGFSVALVALPLALGIATAAGAPPISGLVSCVVAGLVATFVRGSKVGINGPGNSLVVIVAGAFAILGGPESFPHVLGAVVIAGGIQALFGLLRLGRVGDIIPPAVIQGMLAAIGLIIVSKQAHVVFGHAPPDGGTLDAVRALPATVAGLDPAATVIGVLSVVILAVHPKIKTKLVHFVPAPLWVVIFAIPIAFAFEDIAPRLGPAASSLALDPHQLVAIPDDLLGSLVHPDFSRVGEVGFWQVVLTLTLVTSIENIVSVKAVDKLDSFRRRSDLNRDLVGMGLATIASGFLGGLPVLTVVARSSVNVNHGAKTGWSNFFAGLIILVFVVFLSPIIQEIALAALAGVLVYTGYKLAAPHVVEDVLRKGPDHFLVFGITLAVTLVQGLLWGITVGLAAELLSHLLILGLPPREALRILRETDVESIRKEGEPRVLRLRGVASFLTIPKLRQVFEELAPRDRVIVDFSEAMLVDNCTLDYCHEFRRRFEQGTPEASFELIGLEAHRAISDHPDALHAQERRQHAHRLTPRQKEIAEAAEARGWVFDPKRDWDPDHLDDFHFFRVHPIEYRDTVVHGTYELDGSTVDLTLSDVTFDEGVLVPEVYHTTTLHLRLPFEVPELILEQEELIDRAFELAGFQDIDFKHFTGFSRRFVLKGPDEAAIREFMREDLLRFFEREEVYHLESTGHELVLFKTFVRRATPQEIEQLLAFGERLTRLLDGASLDAPGASAESATTESAAALERPAAES